MFKTVRPAPAKQNPLQLGVVGSDGAVRAMPLVRLPRRDVRSLTADQLTYLTR